jgi:hypothetical protein
MPEMIDKPSKEFRIPTVDLTESLHKRLKAYIASHKNEPAISEVVRTALDRFLPELPEKKGKA